MKKDEKDKAKPKLRFAKTGYRRKGKALVQPVKRIEEVKLSDLKTAPVKPKDYTNLWDLREAAFTLVDFAMNDFDSYDSAVDNLVDALENLDLIHAEWENKPVELVGQVYPYTKLLVSLLKAYKSRPPEQIKLFCVAVGSALMVPCQLLGYSHLFNAKGELAMENQNLSKMSDAVTRAYERNFKAGKGLVTEDEMKRRAEQLEAEEEDEEEDYDE